MYRESTSDVLDIGGKGGVHTEVQRLPRLVENFGSFEGTSANESLAVPGVWGRSRSYRQVVITETYQMHSNRLGNRRGWNKSQLY